MAIIRKTGVSGLGASTGGIVSGGRVGANGLGASTGSIKSGSRVGSGGLGAQSGNPSSIPNSGAIGGLGAVKGGSGIPNSGAIGGLGAVKGGSGIPNSGPIGGLGAVKGGSRIPSSGAIGGLGSRSSNSGLSGGKLGDSTKTKKGGRRRTSRPPRNTTISEGSSLVGSAILKYVETFDDLGNPVLEVLSWRATINGRDWTPTDFRVHEDRGIPLTFAIKTEDENSETYLREDYFENINLEVAFDSGIFREGRIINRRIVNATGNQTISSLKINLPANGRNATLETPRMVGT